MISLIRYNLKIVAPALLWTGILVAILVALVLVWQFRDPKVFTAEAAGSIAEQLIPVMAAFFAAGVLDSEMKRGAHELLCSKRRPLWHTVAYRVGLSLLLSMLIGAGVLAALHFGLRRIPVGILLVAALPSAAILAMVALWVRVRLGNAFMGYVVALGIWLGTTSVTGLLYALTGVQINPLFTLTSYTDRLHALGAGALETTPYVDWWWVNKLVLLLATGCVMLSVVRRVEHLVEPD